MSSRTKEERRLASLPPGMLPKAERRAIGKIEAAKRARVRRRKKIMNNVVVPGAVLVVVGLIIAAVMGAFGGKKDDSTTSVADGNGSPTVAATPTTPAVKMTPGHLDPKLSTKPAVTKGEGDVTKLVVTTLIKGDGPAVKAGQSIEVNYVGVTYSDGKEFDSSWSHNQSVSFPIGVGRVIKGWDDGLVGVPIGSRVQLDIPSDLAYGDDASSGSPVGDLRFVVDILSAT